jgi:hypothetical protein
VIVVAHPVGVDDHDLGADRASVHAVTEIGLVEDTERSLHETPLR